MDARTPWSNSASGAPLLPERAWRRTGRVDPAQRGHECGEVDGSLVEVVDRAVGVGSRAARRRRTSRTGSPRRGASGELHRHRERQLRCEPRQPLRLFGCLVGGPADARQPRRQLVTEPVDVVVGPVGVDQLDRQVGPLRELPGEQSAYQGDVGLDLVGVHLGSGIASSLVRDTGRSNRIALRRSLAGAKLRTRSAVAPASRRRAGRSGRARRRRRRPPARRRGRRDRPAPCRSDRDRRRTRPRPGRCPAAARPAGAPPRRRAGRPAAGSPASAPSATPTPPRAGRCRAGTARRWGPGRPAGAPQAAAAHQASGRQRQHAGCAGAPRLGHRCTLAHKLVKHRSRRTSC